MKLVKKTTFIFSFLSLSYLFSSCQENSLNSKSSAYFGMEAGSSSLENDQWSRFSNHITSLKKANSEFNQVIKEFEGLFLGSFTFSPLNIYRHIKKVDSQNSNACKNLIKIITKLNRKIKGLNELLENSSKNSSNEANISTDNASSSLVIINKFSFIIPSEDFITSMTVKNFQQLATKINELRTTLSESQDKSSFLVEEGKTKKEEKQSSIDKIKSLEGATSYLSHITQIECDLNLNPFFSSEIKKSICDLIKKINTEHKNPNGEIKNSEIQELLNQLEGLKAQMGVHDSFMKKLFLGSNNSSKLTRPSAHRSSASFP